MEQEHGPRKQRRRTCPFIQVQRKGMPGKEAWIEHDGRLKNKKLYYGEDGNSMALAPRGKDLRENMRP